MDNQEYELYHYGIKGMKWGIRRYQNYDGSLTPAGVKRQQRLDAKATKKQARKDARTKSRALRVLDRDRHNAERSIGKHSKLIDKYLSKSEKYADKSEKDHVRLAISNSSKRNKLADKYTSELDKLERDYNSKLGRLAKTTPDVQRLDRKAAKLDAALIKDINKLEKRATKEIDKLERSTKAQEDDIKWTAYKGKVYFDKSVEQGKKYADEISRKAWIDKKYREIESNQIEAGKDYITKSKIYIDPITGYMMQELRLDFISEKGRA